MRVGQSKPKAAGVQFERFVSGHAAQPRDPQVRLQPLGMHGQSQRLKPLASSATGGIAKAMP
ncbi:hypothetical protein SBA1_710026 [Candidatus Sulfotelmatobacter kueseliae]|uniref:Uncharacterized protein n=1 Tax=Candidatus Sulfotelmatobacter kueseliae TaxID=2042962 RepID=A0A2U3L5C5_9BACT|nr:hypothetical protein SBA1_710026 [Candidatus Sulfotelmatobacter kueseliae]